MPLLPNPGGLTQRRATTQGTGADTRIDGYASVPLTKGSFTRASNRFQVIRFMYNPTTFQRGHGWEWGRRKMRGRSHPFISGGSGNSETFSFQLFLDGDRGRMAQRPRFTSGARVNDLPAVDVAPEVNALLSLVRPKADDNDEFSYGTPDGLRLSLGSALRGEVVINTISVAYEEFLPDLSILRSTVDISGEVIEARNSTDWLFQKGAVSNIYTQVNETDPISAAGGFIQDTAAAALTSTVRLFGSV